MTPRSDAADQGTGDWKLCTEHKDRNHQHDHDREDARTSPQPCPSRFPRRAALDDLVADRQLPLSSATFSEARHGVAGSTPSLGRSGLDGRGWAADRGVRSGAILFALTAGQLARGHRTSVRSGIFESECRLSDTRMRSDAPRRSPSPSMR